MLVKMLSNVQVFEEECNDLVELVEGIVLTGIVDGVLVEPFVCSASARCLGCVRRVDEADGVVGVVGVGVGVDGVDGARTAQRG
eukprot:1549832-Amphidinium_carterae.1